MGCTVRYIQGCVYITYFVQGVLTNKRYFPPPLFFSLFSINLFPPPTPLQLLSHPISKFQARALKAVAEVTGGNIHHHFTLLLPALIKAIVKAEEGGGVPGEEGG